ncbi:hypothetical protein QZH41_014814, partial [Actinostola sp. cb2023]
VKNTKRTALKKDYKVKIISNDDFNPNDQVFVQFHGKDKETDFKDLTDIYQKFQGKNEAVFDVKAKDIDSLDHMSIKRKVNGPKTDWYIQKIEVRDPQGKVYEFMCKCLLAKDVGLIKTALTSNVINGGK